MQTLVKEELYIKKEEEGEFSAEPYVRRLNEEEIKQQIMAFQFDSDDEKDEEESEDAADFPFEGKAILNKIFS